MPLKPGTRIVTLDTQVMAAPALFKIRAIAYVRVSKAREVMISPELQLMKINGYAGPNDIEIVDVVEDLDESGRSSNYERRKILSIIDRVKNGEANAVIVWKFSRFGRSKVKNGVYIEMLEEGGGRLISATEIGNEDSSTGRLSRGLIMEIDQFQAAQIGEGWKTTFENRLGKGLPHSGRPSFGYMRCGFCERNDQNNGYAYCEHCSGVFVIDPVRGPILREVYTRFLAGESLRSIASDMTERGITSAKGNPMKYRSWLSVMDTGFGAGLLRSRSDTRKKANANTNLFESYDVWTQGAHPALITMKQWEAYKKLRLKRQKMPARARNPRYAFAGLLRCGGQLADGSPCLSVLTAQPATRNGKRYVYYRCPDRMMSKTCNGGGVAETTADGILLAWLVDQAYSESSAEAAMLDAAKADEARATITDCGVQIEKIRADLLRIARGWIEKKFTDAVYRELQDEAEEKLEKAHARQAMAEQVLAAIKLCPNDYRPLADNWRYATGEEKGQFLRHVVDHIIAVQRPGRTPNTCRVIAKGEPYDYVLPLRGSSNSRRRIAARSAHAADRQPVGDPSPDLHG